MTNANYYKDLNILGRQQLVCESGVYQMEFTSLGNCSSKKNFL